GAETAEPVGEPAAPKKAATPNGHAPAGEAETREESRAKSEAQNEAPSEEEAAPAEAPAPAPAFDISDPSSFLPSAPEPIERKKPAPKTPAPDKPGADKSAPAAKPDASEPGASKAGDSPRSDSAQPGPWKSEAPSDPAPPPADEA